MRILIVNAHAGSPSSQKAFQALLACIKEAFRVQNGVLEIKDEYFIRTKDSIDDFLYDEATSFGTPAHAKQFDSLDFVIISGDLHILPWQPATYKIVTMIKMCLKVKKCLFAIGFAMQALVYLSASNIDHPINIVNGGGKGGKLGDMSQLTLRPEDIGGTDYFLDNVTGDLYQFLHESKEWAPLCNAGLHHSRTALEYNTIGKFVIKTPIYRPKKSIHNNGQMDILDENVETKCYLKKIHLKHWLFNNCGMEFGVPYRGRWEVHSFSFTSRDKAFEVLAESEHGPLVIEYPRIIGVKFNISKRYPETYEILQNFIIKYSNEIMSTGKSQNQSILNPVISSKYQTITFRHQSNRDSETGSFRDSIYGSQRSNNALHKTLQGFKYNGPNTTHSTTEDDHEHPVFKHSGMASKFKGKLILDHNFISADKVRYDSNHNSPVKPDNKVIIRDAPIETKAALSHRKHILEEEDDSSFLEAHRESPTHNPDRSILKSSGNIFSRNSRLFKAKGVSICLPNEIPGRGGREGNGTMTKADIRRLLYPELYEVEPDFDKKSWIPGNLSQNRTDTSFRTPKAIRITTGSPGYRKKGPIMKTIPNEGDSATLRASCPYTTYYDVAKTHQKREDEKILASKKFILSKGPTSINQTMRSTSTSTGMTRYASMMARISKQSEYY